jgi:TPR repeat protein
LFQFAGIQPKVSAMIRIWCVISLIAGLAAPSPAAADLYGGIEAYAFKEFEKAYKLLLPEAQQGNPTAQLYVGTMLEAGVGVPRNRNAAIPWYRKAADQGLPGAIYTLGRIYYDGIVVSQDRRRGANLILKAAQMGDPVAQSEIGLEYEKGIALPKDLSKAAYWYRRAALQGDEGGQLGLGGLLADGIGAKADKVRGLMWQLLAAKQDKRVTLLTDSLKETMTPEQIKRAKELVAKWRPQPEQRALKVQVRPRN